jgi:hypothetical protein
MALEKNIPVFKEKLEVSEFDKTMPKIEAPRLFEFSKNKDYIVREIRKHMFEKGQYLDAEKTAREVKGLFDELRDVYEINAPVNFVVSNDENGKETFYSVIDKIEAKKIEDLDLEEQSNAKEGLKKIFTNLFSYYETKNASGENFLADIPEIDQYVYGAKKGESVNKWYLIDTDPLYSKDTDSLADSLDALRDEIESVTEKYGLDLKDIHNKCEKLLETL